MKTRSPLSALLTISCWLLAFGVQAQSQYTEELIPNNGTRQRTIRFSDQQIVSNKIIRS